MIELDDESKIINMYFRRAILIVTQLLELFPPWTSGWVADSSDFGLLGEQNFPKWDISCPGRRWTTVQNFAWIKKYTVFVIKDICSRLQSFCPSNPEGIVW